MNIKTYRFVPVAGLTNANTASGDMWVDRARSQVKVNLGGTVRVFTVT